MRHSRYLWPWRYAYSGQFSPSDCDDAPRGARYESRWQAGRNFGVRRPLRYLSYKLDLDDGQTRRIAVVLNQLKTEREQAGVDEKRTVSEIARLLESGTPSLDDVRTALAGRVASAERLREETAKALVAISECLDDDQREEFINLLLTGAISI